MTVTSNINPLYQKKNFQPIITIDGINYRDTLAQKYVDFIPRLTAFATFIYTGEQLTTISYRFYGTTTLWWLILMFNGYYHWMEIDPGTILRIPSKVEIDSYISQRSPTFGRRISI